MPEAVENVFRHATADVQAKITRVIDVWKQRSIFSPDILEAISARISSQGKQQPRPQSSGSNGLPHELAGIAEQYTRLFGMTSSSSLALGTANSLYSSLIENDMKPSPDLYVAKLRQLGSSLTLAATTVQNSVKHREEMITQLQALLATNTSALAKDKETLTEIHKRQDRVKADAADADQIMTDQQQSARSTTPEMEPPVAEAIVSQQWTRPFIIASLTCQTPLTGPEDSDMPVDPFKLEEEPAEKLPGAATPQDPVAKLQMELHPSITELLARQANGATSEDQSQAQDDEVYIP